MNGFMTMSVRSSKDLAVLKLLELCTNRRGKTPLDDTTVCIYFNIQPLPSFHGLFIVPEKEARFIFLRFYETLEEAFYIM